MPCRDDRDDAWVIRDYTERNDKLARINCTLLRELEALDDGTVEAIILRDPEVGAWWRDHKESDRLRKLAEEKERKKEAEKARLARVKEDLMATLTEDQKKALGIK
jgi:hypothetical protein